MSDRQAAPPLQSYPRSTYGLFNSQSDLVKYWVHAVLARYSALPERNSTKESIYFEHVVKNHYRNKNRAPLTVLYLRALDKDVRGKEERLLLRYSWSTVE
jgi:hypothetical protein